MTSRTSVADASARTSDASPGSTQVRRFTYGVYLAKRLLHGVIVVLAAYTLTFFLLFILPGDPVEIMLAGQGETLSSVDPAVVQALREKYGFDQPPLLQYFSRLGAALTGDLGTSIKDGREVLEVLGEALPYTLQLGVVSLILAFVMGIIGAVVSNLPSQKWLRTLLFSIPPILSSMPGFLVGLGLIYIFAFGFRLLPAVGSEGIQTLILPAFSIAIPASAGIAQVTSRALHDSLNSSYGDYLRAKGIGRTRILFNHSLRNAIIPATTMLGVAVGGVLAGAVVTETIFSRQGIGRIMQQAVNIQDIPLVQGVTLACAVMYAVASLIVDLLYPKIDPRVVIK